MTRILSILLLVVLCSGHLLAGEPSKAATRTIMISGKVSDPKSNELLAGVKIECEACEKVVYSDLDGRFFIYLQIDASQNPVIEFTQVGYNAKTLKLQDIGANAGNLEISLEQE
jgi:hypothetical protein